MGHGHMRNERNRDSRTRRGIRLPVWLLAGFLALPGTVQAQDADFLFRNPRVTLAFHGGLHQARSNSEVFVFTTDNLTVDMGDFDTPAWRAELGIRVAPRVDIAVDVAWSSADVRSETRDFVGTDDLPIRQTTRFSQTPVSFNAKYYLKERGRSIGEFAWIPSSWSAYVGGGVGVANYSFEQTGEFVIEETLDIVFASLTSSSRGTLTQVLAGVEYGLASRFAVVLDGRYRWATAEMRDDWVEFDNIDLSGLSLSLGLALRL